MPIAWLLCGISGSGKTTLAKELSMTGARLLSVDEEMWLRHGSEFPDLPSSRQRELTLEIEAELRDRMAQLLKQGDDVVVDSCLCKRFKRDAFRQRAEESGGEPRLIYLYADRETLLKRLADRRGRHANDIIVTAEQLERFLVSFQPPQSDETIVELSSLNL